MYTLSMENVKETFNQRIKRLIAKSKYKNLRKFHNAIVEVAGKDAITYGSLRNAMHLCKKPHEKTLFQIATILKLDIYDLIKGTNLEPSINGAASGYIQLNESSSLHNLYHGLPFNPELIKINAFGQTIDEQKYFFDGIKRFRFIYVTKGTVDVILKHKDREQERRELKKGEVYCFDSSILHYFKNNNAGYAEILIVHFKQGTPFDV